jgi:hypothetical protein
VLVGAGASIANRFILCKYCKYIFANYAAAAVAHSALLQNNNQAPPSVIVRIYKVASRATTITGYTISKGFAKTNA